MSGNTRSSRHIGERTLPRKTKTNANIKVSTKAPAPVLLFVKILLYLVEKSIIIKVHN